MLPEEMRRLVDRTLAAARLSGGERQRVRQELESHFVDGIAAGVSPQTLTATFGDPGITGSLIGRSRRSPYRTMRHGFLLATAAAAACYIAAVISVQTASDSRRGRVFAEEAESVSGALTRAASGLTDADRIAESYRVAAAIRRRRDYWSETAAVILLDRVARAADSLLREPDRAWLTDSLRALAASEGLAPRREVIAAAKPILVASIYGRNGRVGPLGRRLIVRAKGGEVLSARAVLLEPFYFALPVSRGRLAAMIGGITDARLVSADRAARRLGAR